MANWLSGLKQLFQGGRGRRRPIRKQAAAKTRRREMALERLEDRVTPSTLSLTAGNLKYLATSTETNNLTVSYSSATHKYTFADTGATITSTIPGESGSGTHTVTVPDTTVTTIAIDLSANANNDKANIDSINAATTVTTGGGMNTVNVSSNAPTNTGNLAGIAAALTVTSTNGGYDSLVMSNFSAATGDSNVVVGSSTITGFAPNTVTYNTASGGSFSLVRLIGSNSPTLAEKFTENDPNASTFQLDSNAGPDTAIIEGTNSSTTNNINMGAGAATVTVSSDGSATGNLDGILGTLNINEGSGSGKTLNLIDYGSATGKTVTVSGTAVSGFAPATINYKAVGGTFSNITLSGSNTVSDSFTVTANSPALNLQANGGGDTFVLENNATVKSIAGGSGADALTYGSGYTNAVSVTLAGSNANGFSSGSATGISGGFTGIDVLNGAGSSTLTGESAASTWTVNAVASNSTYNDGTDNLTFSGFSTLDGGTGGNTFNLGAGASGYAINGNTGSDTLTGVSNAALTASTGSGFSGTASSSIAFSAIDTLDGSGSLTGENAASVWTVSATPSYFDGSNTLDFSGFTTLDAGTGGDTFNVSGGASGYTLNGNTGADTLTGVSNATLTSSTASGFSGTASSSIAFSAIDTLDGSGSLTGENAASVWTVSATPSYFDGSNTLDFSGFTTLDAGTGGDTFNVSGGASGYTLNGNTGADTLTGVSNATLTSSTASGFSGTASSSIAFSAIDTLDGSGSLTGENAASVWTVSATPSYFDGSNTLDFSGFTTLDAGTGGDTFNVSGGASGYTLNGNTGSDTLTGVSNPTLTGSGTSNGYSGSADNSISFTGIDVLSGSGTFTGDNNPSAFTINNSPSSSIYNDGATPNSLSFSGFSTIAGGAGNDVFTITTPGSATLATLGTLDGGGGSNTLDATNVNFTQQIADGYNYTDFQTIVTSGTFYGPNTDTTWEWNGTNWTMNTGSGPVSIGTPTTIEGGSANDTFIVDAGTTTATNLYGNAGDDTFTIESGASATGAVDGGTGSNTLNVAGSVTLTGSENDSSETGYAGTNANLGASGFVGIGVLNDDPGDTLTGLNTASTWSVAGTGGTYSDGANSLGFSGFGTLQAGSGGDTFTLTGNASVNLDGGAGNDSFNVDGNALTGAISGGAGTDSLAVSTDVTLTGADATGFSGSSANVSGGFSGIDSLVDDPGDTLTGLNTASTWSVAGNSGTYTNGANSLSFSGFGTLQAGSGGDTFTLTANATFNLDGGAGNDSFNVDGNVLTGAISGGAGSNSLAVSSDVSLTGESGTGFSGASTLISGGFTGINSVTDDPGDTLTGLNTASTWSVAGNSGTYSDGANSLAFSGFGTLQAGSGGDTFTLTANATFNLDGGAGNDSFTVSTYTLTGSISGGAGSNSLAVSSDVSLTGESGTGFSGASTLISGGFTGINSVTDDPGDTLTGLNTASTWSVAGNSGTYSDGANSLAFSGFGTLQAGSGGDTFTLTGNASVNLDGGAGDDSFTVSTYTLTGAISGGAGSNSLAVSSSVSLTGESGTGFSGASTLISGGFSGIDSLVDDPGDTLTGLNTASTWSVAGTGGTYSDGANSLGFSGFGTLQAGSGGDTFTLTANATFNLDGGAGNDSFNVDGNALTGAISGGAGSDTLAVSGDTTLTGADSTGFSGSNANVSGGFTGIDSLVDDPGDTLTGLNTASTWSVAGTGGTYSDGANSLGFSGFGTLQAGSGGDTFTLTGNASVNLDGGAGDDSFTVSTYTLTGAISGGAGSNSLAVSSSVSLTGESGTGFSGASTLISGGFSGIDSLVDDPGDTLTGLNTASTWSVAGTGGTYSDGANSLGFSGFGTLQAGSGGDTFTLTANATFNLDGGAGNDSFTVSTYTLTGGISGGAGSDTLAVSGDTTLTGADSTGFSGSNANVSGGFTGIDSLVDDPGDTLTGLNTASTWSVAGNSGAYTNGANSLSFSGFGTLQAGSGGDTFTLTANATFNLDGGAGNDSFNVDGNALTGAISGGAGSDTLTVSGDTTLTGADSTGFSGSNANVSGGFTGIDSLVDDPGDTLTGLNTASTWSVAGTGGTYTNGANSLSFSGFGTLQAGSGGDTFTLTANATFNLDGGSGNDSFTVSTYTLTGAISGGAGSDTLAVSTDVTLTGADATGFSGSSANVSGGFTGIDSVTDDPGDTLTGLNTASTWSVAGNSGAYTNGANSLSFSGFGTLQAGSGGDTFTLTGNASVNLDGGAGDDSFTVSTYTLTGGISGGAGSDTLAVSGDVTLTGADSTGFSGANANVSGGFTGIDSLVDDPGDTLTGLNTASTWSVSATPSYSEGGFTLTFSGYTTLDGGTGGNAFNVSVGGYTLNGNSGTDTLTFTASYGDANATLTGSSANGYNGSESVSGTNFNAIDQLFSDPSNINSLTNGEGVSATWDLAGTQTYNDGTVANDLVFANFQTLNGGAVGDAFNVTVTTAGVPLTLNGNGGGSDTFNVGFNGTTDPNDENLTGSLANVQGAFTINGVGATLNVSDAADTTAAAWTFTASDIQSGSAGDIIYNGPSTINAILGLPTGVNRNAVDIESLVSGTLFTLTSQGNSDVQLAQVGQDTSALTGASINLAGTSSDTLTVNDQADIGNNDYTVSDSNVATGSITVGILGQFGQVIVYGGSGANTFDVTPSTGTTFALDGGSSGNNTLTYHQQPGEGTPVDSGFIITDPNLQFLPVYYFDFATVNIV